MKSMALNDRRAFIVYYVFNSFKFFLIYFNFVFPFFSYFIRLRTSLIYCM